ncbi:MAG: oligosaccharide flippase family protein [Crocinitomicaceae bacterium]
MQKKFFSNLLLMLVLNLLVKPISIFGIDTGVQNRVGSEAYGLYFTLLNLSFLFNILLDVGINNFTTKNVAQYPHIVSRYMGKMLSFRFILFAVYALVTFLAAFFLGFEKTNMGMLFLLVVNQFIAILIAYIRSHFAGWLYFRLDAIFSVLDRLLLIFLCGSVFVWSNYGHPFQIEWFVWLQTLSYGLSLVFAYWVLNRKIGRPKIKFDWVFSMAILRKSLPYALLILFMMLYTRMDSIMLERLHLNGAHETGIYAQGFRLLDAFFMFGMIFTGLLLPLFTYQMKDRVENLKLLQLASQLLVGGAILVGFLCYFNAEIILSAIYKNDIQSTIPAFRWLMISFIAMGISLIFGTYLTAAHEMRFLNRLAFAGIVINFGFNFYWIPIYGAEGAAWTALLTQSTIAIFQAAFVIRNFGFSDFKKYIVQFSVYIAGLWIGVQILHPYLPFPLLVELIVGIILLMVSGLWNPKEIIELVLKRNQIGEIVE